MQASLLAWVGAAAAVGLAFRHHRKSSGNGPAAALLALLVAGSACWVELASPASATGAWVAAACVVAALAVAFEHEPFPGGRAAEVYPDTGSYLLPALSVLLIALAMQWSPVSIVLLAPVVAALPRARRKVVLAMAVLAVAVVGAVALLRPAGELAWPTLASLLHRFDPALYGWNLAYLVAGRNFGLLVWYLPALLLIATYRPGTRRGWLLAAVAAGTLALPLISPHDFAGGPRAVTNRAFLPLYGALWLLPVRVPRRHWLALTAIAAGLFLWPAWRAPLATAAGSVRPAFEERSLASFLLYETTQEGAPAFARWQGTGVLSKSLGPALRDGDDGPVFAAAGGRAELMIAAERPLETVLVDFGPRAGSELEVTGGRAGDTVFRPDGGVRFEIALDGASRRHPLWTGDRRHHVYLFEFTMPDAPERPLPVAIMARPADALPRSLDPPGAGEGR